MSVPAPSVRPAAARQPIRDAATLILLDRAPPEPRVLMGRRHGAHVFLPGQFVFPGGRVEPDDRRMPSLGALDARSASALRQRLRRPNGGLGRALALTAIRETFEETGLMLGERSTLGERVAIGGRVPAPCPPGWAAFEAEGVLPRLDALRLVARAITPPERPRRFDTRFFIADRAAIAHELPGVVHAGAELVELAWVGLDRAAELDLPRVTRRVLVDLRTRVAAGPGADLPIPFYHERHGRPRRDLL